VAVMKDAMEILGIDGRSGASALDEYAPGGCGGSARIDGGLSGVDRKRAIAWTSQFEQVQ